jgi:hypothetical protein
MGRTIKMLWAVVALAAGLVLLLARVAWGLEPGEPGTVPPAFIGNTIDGTRVSTDSLRGKPLVLVFWGSW